MPSFAGDIKPLFRERDRGSMLSHFDLWSYEDVVQSKDAILGSLTTGDPKAAPRHNPLSLTLAHSLAKLRKAGRT